VKNVTPPTQKKALARGVVYGERKQSKEKKKQERESPWGMCIAKKQPQSGPLFEKQTPKNSTT
jgi:hypothetical protein